jgi:hypothetical protein
VRVKGVKGGERVNITVSDDGDRGDGLDLRRERGEGEKEGERGEGGESVVVMETSPVWSQEEVRDVL